MSNLREWPSEAEAIRIDFSEEIKSGLCTFEIKYSPERKGATNAHNLQCTVTYPVDKNHLKEIVIQLLKDGQEPRDVVHMFIDLKSKRVTVILEDDGLIDYKWQLVLPGEWDVHDPNYIKFLESE